MILAIIKNPNKWTKPLSGYTDMNLDGLEKLFNLKKKGVLTDEEYIIEKAKLKGKY